MSGPEEENVQVVVRLRPPSSAELESCCRIVAHKTPGEPQLALGDKDPFTFDWVYPTDSVQDEVFDSSIKGMVDGALRGRNQTVLAYGQTGSGKTYTMGTGFEVDLPLDKEGIVPRAVKYLFTTMHAEMDKAGKEGRTAPEFEVTVSFLELYCGAFYDLLDEDAPVGDGETLDRQPSNIRILDEKMEDGSFHVHITNIRKISVLTVQDLMERLRRGSMRRVTKSTEMNATSSRSHAVFTLHITHKRVQAVDLAAAEAASVDGGAAAATEQLLITTSKFNFVDLAGSERLKRTGATGATAKEGININSGLLALGNVISALGDPTKKGSHVPYRDSKLTRLLQDSLGGNSRTVMIACISPVDRDFIETLNTLKYANRARNIKNKVVINQDSATRQIQMLHTTIARLQRELSAYRDGEAPAAGGGAAYGEFDVLQQENESLHREVRRLRDENRALIEGFSKAKRSAAEEGDGATPSDRDLVAENVSLRAKLTAAEAASRRIAIAAGAAPDTAWAERPGTSTVIDESLAALQRGKDLVRSTIEEESDDDTETVDTVDQETEEVEDYVEIDDGDEKPERQEGISPSHGTDRLVQELSAQITVQEKLVAELAIKETELARQRKIFEEKLKAIAKEKELVALEYAEIKSKMAALSGSGSSAETRALRKKYKLEMKEKEARIKHMENDARRRDRELAQNEKARDQIKLLRADLAQAKKERKQLLQAARTRHLAAEKDEARRRKEIAALRKETAAKDATARALHSDLERQTAHADKLKAENDKIRAELGHSVKTAHGEPRRSTRLMAKGKRRVRRSMGLTIKIAKEGLKTLEPELAQAVEYRMMQRETDELIGRREEQSKALQALAAKASDTAMSTTQADAVAEEEEELKTQIEYLSTQIQERQEMMLGMGESGATLFNDPTDLSEGCARFVDRLNKAEAHQLLREFMITSVNQRCAIADSRTKLGEQALQMEANSRLLKSYLSNGVSTTLAFENDSEGRIPVSPSPAAAAAAPASTDVTPNGAKRGSYPGQDVSRLDAKKVSSGSKKPSSPRIPRTSNRPKTSASASEGSSHTIPGATSGATAGADFALMLRGGDQKKHKVARKVEETITSVAPTTTTKGQLLTHTRTVSGHVDELTTTCLHGSMLFTGSKDKRVRVWDLSEGRMCDCLAAHEYLVKKVIHSGAQFFTASRNVLRVWDAATHDCVKVQKMRGDISDMVLSGDGNHIILATEKVLRIWDIPQMKLRTAVTTRAKLEHLVLCAPDAVAATSMNKIVILADVLDETEAPTTPIELSPPHYDKIISIAMAGKYLFSGSRDYSLKRWVQNAAGQKWTSDNSVSGAHESYVSALQSFGGGSRLISASVKGCVKLWDVQSLRCIGEIAAHRAAIFDIAVSGLSIFTASGDGTVKIWQYNDQQDSATDSPRPKEKKVVAAADAKGRRLTYDLGEIESALEGAAKRPALDEASKENFMNSTYKLAALKRASESTAAGATTWRMPVETAEGGTATLSLSVHEDDDDGWREDIL